MKKTKLALVFSLSGLLAIGLSSCGDGKDASTTPTPTTSTIEEKNDNARVFYEIFTSTFSDSNGDGTGDLKGITNRLDYLNDGNPTSGTSLGIGGIWLTPIFKSPSYHRYDTQDYYSIGGTLGTNEDLKELLEEAHKRDIKVILDLAINHTATSNTWYSNFVKAHKNKEESSEWYDWYSWSDTSNVKGKTFKLISGSNHYYECNFDSSMPELNFDNDAVRTEMLNVAKYWLDFGVDGFRFDAAKYIYYNDNQKSAEFWDWYCGELRKYKEDVYTVAEVWDTDSITKKYIPYVNCFNFQIAQSNGKVATAAIGGSIDNFTKYIANYNKSIKELNNDAMLIAFQNNHDLDRSGGYISDVNQYKMAANLCILTPGSPYVYYGEELKMLGYRKSTEMTDANRRLAMIWGDGDKVKDPTGATWKSQRNSQCDSVELQKDDSASVLNYYRQLIAFRNKYPQIANGDYAKFSITNQKIGGFKINYNDKTSFLIHNNQSTPITLDIATIGENISLLGYIGVGNANIIDSSITIDAYTSVLLQ